MRREKFQTRTIRLISEVQRSTLIALAGNIPCDAENPLEIVVREPVKVRGLDANARMWVGPLKDLSIQAYVNGRTFSDVVWHEHCKREYLPETFDPDLCKEGYQKWDYTPSGDKVLVGSTTQLTKRGFALYLQQVVFFGESLGVQFSASPNEGRYV